MDRPVITADSMAKIVTDYHVGVKRRVHEALNHVRVAIDDWIEEAIQGPLPDDWREQFRAVLEAQAAQGRRVLPECVDELEAWIEGWATEYGLLPAAASSLVAIAGVNDSTAALFLQSSVDAFGDATVRSCIVCHNPIIMHGGSIRDLPVEFQTGAMEFLQVDNLDAADMALLGLRTEASIALDLVPGASLRRLPRNISMVTDGDEDPYVRVAAAADSVASIAYAAPFVVRGGLAANRVPNARVLRLSQTLENQMSKVVTRGRFKGELAALPCRKSSTRSRRFPIHKGFRGH